MSYYIRHKGTNKFFAGFDADHQPTWTSNIENAWLNCKNMAEAQAVTLAMMDRQVQKKPVRAAA